MVGANPIFDGIRVLFQSDCSTPAYKIPRSTLPTPPAGKWVLIMFLNRDGNSPSLTQMTRRVNISQKRRPSERHTPFAKDNPEHHDAQHVFLPAHPPKQVTSESLENVRVADSPACLSFPARIGRPRGLVLAPGLGAVSGQVSPMLTCKCVARPTLHVGSDLRCMVCTRGRATSSISPRILMFLL